MFPEIFTCFILGPTAEWTAATINAPDTLSKGVQADWLVVSVSLKTGSRRVNCRMAVSRRILFIMIHEKETVLKLLVCSL